jgi:2'-5' RNA ligase
LVQLTDNPRLFVAVELPGQLRRVLDDLQHELQRHIQGLRWVRPEGIHLTLKFLGEMPEARVDDIKAAVANAAAGVPRHELSLGQLGTFGNRGAPRVLWLDLRGDLDTLNLLQSRVDASLASAGFPRESRPFAAHLTLARVRPETARDVAGALADAMRTVEPPSGSLPVRQISLMLSRLGPGGAVYKRLGAWPLG